MMAQRDPVAVDLTATQYVILSENQRKKKALADTTDAYNQLLAENQVLEQQLEDANKESYHVTEHFRQEVLAKNQAIADLQTQLEQLRADKDEHISRLQDQAAAREQELQSEMEAMSTELVGRIDNLQAELDSLLDFKQKKAESEAALVALREESVGLREALETQRTQLERHYAGLHSKLRKEYEQKLEELKRSQEEELEERLDAGVKRILAANRRLAEELRLHITESDALQSELRLLQDERSRLAREVSLKQELEAGWAQRAGQQAAALKDAQAKVLTLEKSLQQVLADFAQERAAVVTRATAQVNAAGSEVEVLRRLLRLKGRELQQLRQLSHEVLLQRSEVEIFLLSSLHQVRLAMEHEHSAGASKPAAADGGCCCSSSSTNTSTSTGTATIGCTAPSGTETIPAMGRPADMLQGGHPSEAAVPVGPTAACVPLGVAVSDGNSLDIRDLSWVDRERVLRLLLSKLHGKVAQQHELLMVQHPLDAAALSAVGSQRQRQL